MTMGTDKHVTAAFILPHTLTVARSGSGTGTVTSSPAGIQCGATCAAAYDQAASVTLTATPAAGSRLAGWSGSGCSGAGTCTVAMAAERSVTATFVAVRSLTVAVTGSGRVSSAPAGIDCGGTCTAHYDDGTPITLTATAAPGFHFAGWSGDCAGTAPCTLTMSGDRTATATFAANAQPVMCHVPKVRGERLAAAESAIARAKCRVGAIKKAYSARVRTGRVISQAPAAGAVVPQGTKVTLKVSKGKKR